MTSVTTITSMTAAADRFNVIKVNKNLKNNTFGSRLGVLFYWRGRMTKGIFVTATGTDVGKTFISALIVKKLRDLEINCGYYKPALSGAEEINGKLIPGDCEYVLKTAGISANPSDFASYIFKTAVSPHLAAEIEGVSIKKNKILSDFNKKKEDFDYLVVEGAGGIICPFKLKDEKIILPDVIKMLGLDVVIVSTAALGSINNAVLPANFIKNSGINIKGFILNNYDENDFMQRDNKLQIENLTGVKVIATVKKDEKDMEIKNEKLLSIFKEI